MMQSDDFRYSSYAPKLDSIARKKDLELKILQEHPRAKNMYRYVQSEYKKEFSHAYNGRCAYCGLPIGVVPVSGFEIDHILCQDDSNRDETILTGYIHGLDNLALACSYCNGKKSNFLIGTTNHKTLSPDHDLGRSFVREEDFHIGIADEHANHEDIVSFHAKMNYGSELRRVDYVLSSLIDLRDQCNATEASKRKRETIDVIERAINTMILKRNRSEQTLIEQH